MYLNQRVYIAFSVVAMLVYMNMSLQVALVRNVTNDALLMGKNSKVPKILPPDTPVKIESHDIIYGHNHTRNTVPIVNEEYNIIFFDIAKVACTEWKRFFSRLQGSPNWCLGNPEIHDPSVNGLKFLSDYTMEEAQTMMISPKWKKAIFVRHPKPRILSAFLDKAVGNSEQFLIKNCRIYVRQGGGNYDDCGKNRQDFGFFLNNFTSLPKIRDNVHWRTIYSQIDEKWWPYVDFVGKMENLNDDAKKLLSSLYSNIDGISAWDKIGLFGWNNDESKNCTKALESDGLFLGVPAANHSTKAKEQMMKFYTPELEALVEKRFKDDLNNPYFHFNELKIFPTGRPGGNS